MHNQYERAIEKPLQTNRLNEAAFLQNNLQIRLNSLINGQAKGLKETFWALARPNAWRRQEAEKLICQYEHLSTLPPLPASPAIEVEIPIYNGTNQRVRRMMAYLAVILRNDLLGAYVHGSLGSNDEIAYSDFDGLVILNEEVLRYPGRLAHAAGHLAYAQKFMLEQDPLQHHGWFVLTPYDLAHFCDAYFPAVLFRYAKSLLPNHDKHPQVFPRDSHYEVRQNFDNLAASILRNLSLSNYRFDLYRLKGLLSQFMLLPAIYVHVRDGQGVWKADSFELAHRDFSPDEWEIMDHISTIRQNWDVSLSFFQRRKLRMPPQIVQKTRRWFSPHVSDAISRLLNDRAFYDMKKLVHRMIERLD